MSIKLCKHLKLKSELVKDRTGCIKCKLREYEPS
jgi:hypothetical protein